MGFLILSAVLATGAPTPMTDVTRLPLPSAAFRESEPAQERGTRGWGEQPAPAPGPLFTPTPGRTILLPEA